mmetsp:Transcript_2186/g.4904  ORF Transcript_2186/g.4904 Transcript_2186/m.4904 type:complete len:241 (+) Transcript_2186:3483-4205(+)
MNKWLLLARRTRSCCCGCRRRYGRGRRIRCWRHCRKGVEVGQLDDAVVDGGSMRDEWRRREFDNLRRKHRSLMLQLRRFRGGRELPPPRVVARRRVAQMKQRRGVSALRGQFRRNNRGNLMREVLSVIDQRHQRVLLRLEPRQSEFHLLHAMILQRQLSLPFTRLAQRHRVLQRRARDALALSRRSAAVCAVLLFIHRERLSHFIKLLLQLVKQRMNSSNSTSPRRRRRRSGGGGVCSGC